MFTWIQALNMLHAGVCKSVTYAPGQGLRGSFELHAGVIYRRLPEKTHLQEGTPLRTSALFVVKDR